MNELLGFIRGLVADRVINRSEVDSLGQWLTRNPESSADWPANVLIDRLQRIYADGVVTEEECNDLRDLLEDIAGRGSDGWVSVPTDLPLTKPEPEVIFDQNNFVLTGRFAYGTRSTCEKEVHARGGLCKSSVTLQTHYLVVGAIGSRDWATSAWGTKILRAVELQHSGPIYIISEQRWAEFLLAA